MEETLRQGATRYDKVHVFLAHEFVSLDQTEDCVVATVRRLEDGAMLEMQARYVIACDGARSPVRQQMGATIEDLAFDEWWIVVDAWLRGQVELPSRCVQYCRPSRPGTYIVGPGDLRRWEIKMLPGERPEDFTDESGILKVLSQFVDVEPLELCRSVVYRFHALVVEQWRFGRVFLMGDAAHQMPPFLGQGLCAAIRDAINLVWKIDAVERLGCTPALLDTYGQERTPHVRTIVSHAKSFGLIIGELDERAARARDASLIEQLASGQAETVRQKFIPGLDAGLVDLDANRRPRAGAGSLFVQPWVCTDGGPFQRLDDLLQPRFLLASASLDVLSWLDDETRELWQRIEGQQVRINTQVEPGLITGTTLVVTERDGIFSAWMNSLGAKVALVRPDRYVYGTANNPVELRQIVGQLGRSMFEGAASRSDGAFMPDRDVAAQSEPV